MGEEGAGANMSEIEEEAEAEEEAAKEEKAEEKAEADDKLDKEVSQEYTVGERIARQGVNRVLLMKIGACTSMSLAVLVLAVLLASGSTWPLASSAASFVAASFLTLFGRRRDSSRYKDAGWIPVSTEDMDELSEVSESSRSNPARLSIEVEQGNLQLRDFSDLSVREPYCAE